LLRLVQRLRQGIQEMKDKNGELPILLALKKGNLDQFKQYLTTSRLSVNAGHPGLGWTLLHHLAALGKETLPAHVKMAEELLKSGADVNCRTALGWTPLHLIAMNGQAESVGVAKVLLANGLDLKAVDNYGRGWEIYWQHGKEIYDLLKNAPAVDR
jgi:ankyrin repeat protein